MVKITRRGLGALSLVSALAFASFIFRDFLIGATLLLVSVAVFAEVVWAVVAGRGLEKRFVLKRDGEDKILLQPGEESVESVTLTKRIGGGAALRSRTNFLRIRPSVVEGQGSTPLEVSFATEYAGEYDCEEVGITATGPIGLFSLSGVTPLRLKYVVYPRLARVAAATVRLLALGEIGETPVNQPGVGSEYYEMRGYQPGDDVRNVNWKASAREGELLVVERMREVGSHYLLVLDTRSRGFDESDRLASAFLSVANSLWTAGVDFGVIVHNGTTVTESSAEDDQSWSLSSALQAAVRSVQLDTAEILELVPTRASGDTGHAYLGDILASLIAARHQAWRSTLKGAEPWSTMAEYVRSSQTSQVVVFASLAGDVRPLLELAWESRHYRNVEFTVANPCGEAPRGFEAPKALGSVGAVYLQAEPFALVRKILE